jgi:hypothetical protein
VGRRGPLRRRARLHRHGGGALQQLVDETGLPEGFFVTTDTARRPNVVLRYECDIAVPSEGPPARHSNRERGVIEALQACAAVASWLRQHEQRLADIRPRDGNALP